MSILKTGFEWFVVALLMLVRSAFAADVSANPINSNAQLPVMIGLGLPAPMAAQVLVKNESQINLSYSVSSNANDAGSFDESGEQSELLIIDNETHSLSIQGRYGLSDDWQINGEFVYLQHYEGFLDGVISSWHDVFDLPQGDRDTQLEDQILIEYQNGNSIQKINSKQNGIGDAKIGLSYRLLDSNNRQGSKLKSSSFNLQANLPLGDKAKLTGSDKTDWSLSLNSAGQFTKQFAWHANLGVLKIGDDQQFGIRTQGTALFSSVGLHWRFAESWQLASQLDSHQALFESNIPELSESAHLLSFALDYSKNIQSNNGMLWRVYFSEDVSVNRAPDFNFGINLTFRH